MYGFSEQNFDVTNYSSVISSITFSKCTKFFNNCLIELSLIITKSRAKLKVMLSESYCICIPFIRKLTIAMCVYMILFGQSCN